MEHLITDSKDASSVNWQTLEDWLRGHVQTLVQELLEAEVTEVLGRSRYGRDRLGSTVVYRKATASPGA